MPVGWATMRSMARWVLPVLVGPSTAVTLLARAAGGSERKGSKAKEPIKSPAHTGESVDGVDAGLKSRPYKNESGAGRGRGAGAGGGGGGARGGGRARAAGAM